jgi:hypothetical protein
MDKQREVYRTIEAASKLLHAAYKLEYSLEKARVSEAIRASGTGYFPDDGVLTHDPLGFKIQSLAYELDELLE